MANAIYRATLPAQFPGSRAIDGAMVTAASTADAIAFLKGQMPGIPATTWDNVTLTAQVANSLIATTPVDLSFWVAINRTYFWVERAGSETLEQLYARLESVIESVHGTFVSYVAGVTSTPGVMTIASGANLGKAAITAGVGYRRGYLRDGGSYIALPSLAPTVNAVQGSDAAARTVTLVAPNSSVTLPTGFLFKTVDLRSVAYNDSAVDTAMSGAVEIEGTDRAF